MADKINIPRGTYDILPDQSYKWHWIIDQFRSLAKSFSYLEIVTPMFESSKLFERSVGETTDIIEKEMYKFTDRKGRTLALRPEGTAPVVRSYIENHLGKDGNVVKLYYQGPMFRYDRPQKGRFRQFYQYGIELLGSANPYYDAEVISLADRFLQILGITKYTLEINSIGCKECSPEYDRALVTYYQKHQEELCGDCLKRMDANPKRLLDCKVQSCKKITEKAPSILDYLDESCRTDFDSVCQYLAKLNVKYTVNPRIVRGLDYYNKTAFEFINTGLKTQNALLGGGRYDTLVSMLGGQDTSAIGFAGGFERLIDAMEAEKLSFGPVPKPMVYVITLGDRADEFAVSLCAQIRSNNIPAEFNIDKKSSLKAQMKAAVKADAKYALIIGDEEIDSKTVNLKNLENATQKIYSADDFIATLSELIV
jgi:histidyl-tRNA synthetase